MQDWLLLECIFNYQQLWKWSLKTRRGWWHPDIEIQMPIYIHHKSIAWLDYLYRIWYIHRILSMPDNHRSSWRFFQEGRKSTTQMRSKRKKESQYLFTFPLKDLRVLNGEMQKCWNLQTWIRPKTISTRTAPNKKGPRKLKSCPLLAAQNV